MEKLNIFLFALFVSLSTCFSTQLKSSLKRAKRWDKNGQNGDMANMFRGTAGVDYPDFTSIPNTSFRCSEQQYEGGLYADVETQCQVYHVCHEGRKNSFLCGKGTIFNQQILACDYWYSSECDTAPNFYHVNAQIGSPGASPNHNTKGYDSQGHQPGSGYRSNQGQGNLEPIYGSQQYQQGYNSQGGQAAPSYGPQKGDTLTSSGQKDNQQGGYRHGYSSSQNQQGYNSQRGQAVSTHGSQEGDTLPSSGQRDNQHGGYQQGYSSPQNEQGYNSQGGQAVPNYGSQEGGTLPSSGQRDNQQGGYQQGHSSPQNLQGYDSQGGQAVPSYGSQEGQAVGDYGYGQQENVPPGQNGYGYGRQGDNGPSSNAGQVDGSLNEEKPCCCLKNQYKAPWTFPAFPGKA